jgi:hypothetical protein
MRRMAAGPRTEARGRNRVRPRLIPRRSGFSPTPYAAMSGPPHRGRAGQRRHPSGGLPARHPAGLQGRARPRAGTAAVEDAASGCHPCRHTFHVLLSRPKADRNPPCAVPGPQRLRAILGVWSTQPHLPAHRDRKKTPSRRTEDVLNLTKPADKHSVPNALRCSPNPGGVSPGLRASRVLDLTHTPAPSG